MATLLAPNLNQQGGGLLSKIDSFLGSPQAMALASSLLKSSGWSTMPTSFGQAFGQGMADMEASKQQQVMDAYKKAATQQIQAQTKTEEQKNLLNEKMAVLIGAPASGRGAPFADAQGSGLLADGKLDASEMQQLAPLLLQAGDTKTALGLLGVGQEGYTLKAGEKRFDASGNLIASGGVDTTQNFDNETKARKEFIGQSKDFVQISDAYGRIVASASDPSAAGDLALIFNYMKVLDPGSVVRETEFATAQNAAGVPERIRAQYNKILEGERLSDATRKDFVDRATKLYEAQEAGQSKIEEQYKDLAKRNGLNPDNVVINYRVDRKALAKQQSLQQQAQAAIAAGADPKAVQARLQEQLMQLKGG